MSLIYVFTKVAYYTDPFPPTTNHKINKNIKIIIGFALLTNLITHTPSQNTRVSRPENLIQILRLFPNNLLSRANAKYLSPFLEEGGGMRLKPPLAPFITNPTVSMRGSGLVQILPSRAPAWGKHRP